MNDLNILTIRIKNKEKTLLIFDYDGTLVPIQPRPDLAKISSVLRDSLENLSKLSFLKIAIVTGREINDFKKVSGLNTKNMIVFGVHGGEIEQNNEISTGIYDEGIIKTIEEIFNELNNECNDLNGIIIEDKKYSVAMHYRMANELIAEKAIYIFNKLAEKYNTENLFKIQTGKKIIEFLPSKFTKSNAVNTIIQANQAYVPFYFGDDITDISAFQEVRKFFGYAIGIKPLPFKSGNIVHFEIAQDELEKFLVNLNNTYGY